ncbi:MAG: hypothetical protein H0T42_22460 [Deltaproteobacteria bacterium]|nr:hypothetical protein [Deltaproteobacteria bacterium]
MTTLVADLLEISRISPQGKPLIPVNLNDVILVIDDEAPFDPRKLRAVGQRYLR